MDDALARWLALRESSDVAARSTELTRIIAEVAAKRDPVNVLDLATGTGSNLRYLIDRLPSQQHWLVVDQSAALLAELPVRTAAWAAGRGYSVTTEGTAFLVSGGRLDCRVETRQADLDAIDTRELDDLDDLDDLFRGRHLVTASALLDLVSERWLRALAARCRRASASALFTISYNGRSSCSPEEPEDSLVLELFNRHQRTDKGLGGPAAGPHAVAAAARCFEEAGYRVQVEPSDWNLGAGALELQRQLINGWAEAATEVSPQHTSTIASWHLRRLAHVNSGRSQIIVGHDDFAAWLPGR